MQTNLFLRDFGHEMGKIFLMEVEDKEREMWKESQQCTR